VTRRIFSIVGVCLVLAAAEQVIAQEAAEPEAPTPAQAEAATAALPVPAATQGEIDCSGFIAESRVPGHVHVLDGDDNDLRFPYHEWLPGHNVFLRGRIDKKRGIGTEYRLVRPAGGVFLGGLLGGDLEPMHVFSHPVWYPGQSWSIRSLGFPYEDVGIVRVIAITPRGAVAEVTFACGAVARGDIAIPFKAREIPTITPGPPPEPFAPVPGKSLKGAITAAADNDGVVGTRSRVYINLGEADGVRVGQRFRVFNVDWDTEGWLKAPPETPPETKGELVIILTRDYSSVGIVEFATREIYLGDGVVRE
jgi:hypothetical protein